MERIIVPLDESPLAEAVLPIVRDLARDREAELILLRAVQPYDPLPEGAANADMRAVAEAEARLQALAAGLQTSGVPQVRWVVWHANAIQAIREAAEAYRADLIAMATHGRGGLSRLLLGSVAAGVVQSVSVPVILVRGQLPGAAWSLRKLLVPLSGDAESEAILQVAARLAGPSDLGLHLLEVLQPLPVAVGGAREGEMLALRRVEAERHLEKLAEGLMAKGLRVTWSVLAGPAAERIVSAARETGVDLVVMATHGRGLLGRLAFGSVADEVLRTAPVPVLLLRVAESR